LTSQGVSCAEWKSERPNHAAIILVFDGTKRHQTNFIFLTAKPFLVIDRWEQCVWDENDMG
jgi:hypothetical protein